MAKSQGHVSGQASSGSGSRSGAAGSGKGKKSKSHKSRWLVHSQLLHGKQIDVVG